MKHWEQPVVSLTYVAYVPELLARGTTCIGSRWNMSTDKRYPVRVYSRDETPLADAMINDYARTHGA